MGFTPFEPLQDKFKSVMFSDHTPTTYTRDKGSSIWHLWQWHEISASPEAAMGLQQERP